MRTIVPGRAGTRMHHRRRAVLAAAVVGLFLGQANAADPPTGAPPALPPSVSPTAPADDLPPYAKAALAGTVMVDPNVTQAGCSTCGGGGPVPAILGGVGGSMGGGAICGDTCGSGRCKPGKGTGVCPVDDCASTCVGRFFAGVGKCLCCPDPCYDPMWVHTANAAFFMDTVRPKTYTRIRWDSGRNVILPDRAEFFWARVGASGGGRGPQFAETGVDYDDLSIYQETASGNFAFFIESPYRAVEPDINARHANFTDINLGTKSLLIDCELMQLAFQFRTYIPVGNSRNGLGTGHTALEPSLLKSLKVNQDTYIQSQVAYWIPLGGDGGYQGATWHYHTSLNHSWCKRGALEFISTAEANGWTFTDGSLTVPVTRDQGITVKASGETYVSLGGGLRVVFCDRMDFGFGAAFAVTSDHFAEQLYRTEFRLRY